MNKKEALKTLIKDLHQGRSEEEVKAQFKKDFGQVSSLEIASMEQELIREGMKVEEIQRLCNVHADVFQGSIEDIHSLDAIDQEMGHPLYVFRKENQGIRAFIGEKLRPLLEEYRSQPDPSRALDLRALMKELYKIDRHYARKENLFFPFLEAAGVTGPPQVMWGKDDEARALIKESTEEKLEGEALIAKVEEALSEVESMIVKENDILSPLLLEHIHADEWLSIAKDSPTIGFAFNDAIPGASISDTNQWLMERAGRVQLGIKKTVPEKNEGDILFPSGRISLYELTHMLNSSPQDITFIDGDDKVRYFSEGKDMVFARTRTIIGRDVRLCHPPKAVPVVEQMLSDFKAGTKDVEVRILEKGTKIFLIRYFAVRDDDGHYVGTLETTEEISKVLGMIQGLKGGQSS